MTRPKIPVPFKPGFRLLLFLGLLVYLMVSLRGQTPLERRLFDVQTLLAGEIRGNPPLSYDIIPAAIDRKAFRAGLRRSDLSEMIKSLPGTAIDISEQDLASYFVPDSDGVLRKVRLWVKKDGKRALSPPLESVLLYRGIEPGSVRIEENGVWLADQFLPTDSMGNLYPVFPMANRLDPRFMVARVERFLTAWNPDNADRFVFKDRLRPVSLVDLLKGEVRLDDKLILIGMYLNEADSVEFDTPTGHMVRLELYTALVNSLLKQDFYTPLSWGWQVALSSLFLLLLSAIFPGRRTLNSCGWWLSWALLWFGINTLLLVERHVVYQSPVLIAGTVMLLVHLLRRSWRVRSLLQSFGGTTPLEKRGDEIPATIMFTNLPDMIKEMEESEPMRAQEARAAHSRLVGYLVNQYGGRLVDLQGDAQMIAFGLEGNINHRHQAVGCAMAIVEQVNALLGADGNVTYCGVVTGPVATGQVGGGSYRGVAAVGDTTNSAARLMGQAKKLQRSVLCCDATIAPLGPRAVIEKVGELSVKGREQTLEAWAVESFETPVVSELKPTVGHYKLPLLAFSLFLGISAGVAYLLNTALPLEEVTLDSVTPVYYRGPVLFAGLDAESLEANPWPWPRSWHAMIAQNCLDAGAQAVFLDFLFENPSVPEEDRALIEVVASEPRVVVAAAAIGDSIGEPQPPELLPELMDAGSWGLINHSPLNEGNRMRYGLWQLRLSNGVVAPGVALKLAEIVKPGEWGKYEHMRNFLIRWGPPVPQVSYHRLLDPSDPIFQEMEGKIVFAGANLGGPTDAFETPVGEMQGALIHAQSLQTILGDNLLTEAQGSLPTGLLVLMFGAVVLYISWRSEGFGSQIFILAAGTVLAMMVVKLMAGFGYFVGTTACAVVPVSVVAARILAVIDANRGVGSYIPSRLQQKLELDGTVADLQTKGTILLTDIRGYTSLSEGRSPSEILALLNSYHEKTAQVYQAHGGHLLTYQGDAQIIVFGPLEPINNPVLHAVQAAREIPNILDKVAEEAGLERGVLRVGAGITTGEITLSLLGISGQMQYSVFGAPVRRAHHLQSLSDKLEASIILDERSRFEVKDVLTMTRHQTKSGEKFYTV